MRIRTVGVLLFVGILCLGTAVADEGVSNLLSKGRQAFKTGNYDDAERYHRLAVDTAERSGDAAQFGEALGDLGGVLLAKGHYDESRGLCLKALEILRNTQAKRYLPVVLNNLSVLSTHDRDYVKSKRYLKESLQAAQEFDPHDPYIARVLNNLGTLYHITRDNGEAEKAFKKAIAFIEKESGSNRVELAPILTNLGAVYVLRKKWDAAATVLDRALLLLRNSVSSNPLDLAGVHDNMGTMHYAQENVPEAERAFRQAYGIRVQALGAKHPKVARAALNLATTLTSRGHFDEAERLYTDALKIYEEALGLRAPEVASTLRQIAELFRKTNRGEAAREMDARAESIRFELEHVVRVEQLQ